MVCVSEDCEEPYLITPERAFGKVIRCLREKRGWSQEELGEAMGKSRNYVGMIEAGQQSPTLRSICHFAEALKIDMWVLMKKVDKRRRRQ